MTAADVPGTPYVKPPVAAGAPSILTVKDLKVWYPIHAGLFLRHVGDVKAVDGVSFSVREGETLGLVGESGCGKTTVGKAILRLVPITSGQVLFRRKDGTEVDLAPLSRAAMRPHRAEVQMIYQDPYSSLNPRWTVGDIVAEPLLVAQPDLPVKDREARVAWLLEKVGLTGEQAYRYPHEFSGGQRQRIGIARALSTSPRLLIADEPVSALDVSIQAQVLNLLQDLQEEFGLTYLFIAHDLSVVEHISHRIAVMYLGHVVEMAPAQDVYHRPLHPYSRALLSAVPLPDPELERAERSSSTARSRARCASPRAAPSAPGARSPRRPVRRTCRNSRRSRPGACSRAPWSRARAADHGPRVPGAAVRPRGHRPSPSDRRPAPPRSAGLTGACGPPLRSSGRCCRDRGRCTRPTASPSRCRCGGAWRRGASARTA